MNPGDHTGLSCKLRKVRVWYSNGSLNISEKQCHTKPSVPSQRSVWSLLSHSSVISEQASSGLRLETEEELVIRCRILKPPDANKAGRKDCVPVLSWDAFLINMSLITFSTTENKGVACPWPVIWPVETWPWFDRKWQQNDRGTARHPLRKNLKRVQEQNTYSGLALGDGTVLNLVPQDSEVWTRLIPGFRPLFLEQASSKYPALSNLSISLLCGCLLGFFVLFWVFL